MKAFLTGVAAALVFALALLGGYLIPRPGVAHAAATAGATQPTAQATPHIYLTIVNKDGKDGSPMYVPADFKLPANSDVEITIRNFDDGADAVTSPTNELRGTIGGTVSLQQQIYGALTAAPATTYTQLPADGVSHTFSITQLGVNVPVPPLSTVTFRIHTGAAGTYTWNCLVPCGTGPAGWGGPMSTPGYMTGTVTIA